MSFFGYDMINRRHNCKGSGLITSTNQIFTPRQTFLLIPPSCLHLSGGVQVVEAATGYFDHFVGHAPESVGWPK
jgi:hypothetical protein